MSERNRVVITGMGAVTPIGTGVEVYWNNLVAGKCGIDRLTHLDVSGLPVQIGGDTATSDMSNLIEVSVSSKV